ncbi:hypothetical protein N5C40_15465 [Pseudomonas fulva]|uniref:hypothetical protein n=1 Tax=Pseudomonas fulva TaxID=47880 RepID=UPI00244CCF8E|nr:hypothetical protein [Pseudomonas fulva]MDH1307938.1 hypothetical protein [Pseudomonas fulva]
MRFKIRYLLWAALTLPLTATSNTPILTVKANPNAIETVFSWRNDRCSDENTPDSPARAFRSNTGQVYVYATHYKNIPLIGTSIDQVKPACNNQFSATFNDNPDQYDARIWLQTFYSTNAGRDIYSLASSDYHGKWFNKCEVKAQTSHDCWMSAIVLAHSDDGGKTFNTLRPPEHIVANSPQKFLPTQPGNIGFLTTSNIVKIDNYYYSLFNTAAFKDQLQGNCLVRTDDLSSASSWRAWDGTSFKDPLRNRLSLSSNGYTCRTLPTLPFKVRSLLWHSASQGYIATFEKTRQIKDMESRTDVIFAYSWSKDLKTWSPPQEIITLKGNTHCKTPQAAGAYPSIIDSESKDENFGTIGNKGYLYYTKFNLSDNCRLTFDRDLVRIPIKIDSQ